MSDFIAEMANFMTKSGKRLGKETEGSGNGLRIGRREMKGEEWEGMD